MFKVIDRFFKSNNLEQYLNKQYFNYLIIAFTMIFAIYLNWSTKETAGLILFVYIVLWLPKSELLARGASLSLIMVPILLVIRREMRAEDFATLAYLLLVATAVVALIENKKASR